MDTNNDGRIDSNDLHKALEKVRRGEWASFCPGRYGAVSMHWGLAPRWEDAAKLQAAAYT